MSKIRKFLLSILFAVPMMVYAQRIPINASLTPQQMFEKAQSMFAKGYADKGIGYLQMSAGKHYLPALKFLAQCYLNGKYVPQNKQAAGRVLEVASKIGDAESASLLGELVKSGAYHPQEDEAKLDDKVVQIINQYNIVDNSPSIQKETVPCTDNEPVADVDENIPTSNGENSKTFAVIISNENYQQEEKVPYAIHDGFVFSEYCNKTLAIPQENIHFVKDATYNNIRTELDWLKQVVEAFSGKAKVIFYYAGHGIPDESTRSSYLLPVDGKGNISSTGFSLSDLYAFLGDFHAEDTWVILDACFSGAKRSGGMLASARGIAIKSKPSSPKGNMVIFSAATGDETAYPYKEKHHGLFTYYLLKALQSTKGDCTMGELAEYIHRNVTQKSIIVNRKSQTPVVTSSDSMQQVWMNHKLK